MRFLVDANLPRPLARWLAADGDEALYVDDLLQPPAHDDAIWSKALEKDCIIVSKTRISLTAPCATKVSESCGFAVAIKLKVFQEWFASRRQSMHKLLLNDERLVELR